MIGSFLATLYALASKAIAFMGFDLSVNLMLTAFGYTLDASYARSKKGSLSVSKLPRSLGRGMTLFEAFKALMNWLVAHSLHIVVAVVVAFLFVVLVRYIFGLLWSGVKAKRGRRKMKIKNPKTKTTV